MIKLTQTALIALGLALSSTAYAQNWSCDNGDKVEIQNLGSSIIINNKYKAHLQGSCDSSQGCGSKGGKVFSNNGYTYKIYKNGSQELMAVTNKWGKDITCR
ncbi:MAG TPA: hypothetical protein PLU46_03335 [Thiotrichales bacterium]|nr:hypothetical protein [Thiotrichales bacterium]